MDDGLALKGQVDMIEDDVVMIFRAVNRYPENPLPLDILFVNACMWMFNKIEGVIVYITPDGKEESFVTNKNQKMLKRRLEELRFFMICWRGKILIQKQSHQ